MKKVIFLLIIVILILFQTTILDYFNIFGVKPNLILISVVIASLYFELKWALFFSVFTGILKDIMGVYAFGINTLLFPIWAFLIIESSKKISTDNNFIPVLFMLIIVILHDTIVRLIFFPLLNLVIPGGVFLRIVFIESLYTVLAFPLIVKVLTPVLDLKR